MFNTFLLDLIAHLVNIEFETIRAALKSADLPSTDLVVGIGSGGIVLSAMAAYKLNTPLSILWLNYRGPNNQPVHSQPELSQSFSLPLGIKKILLVDDVVVSGKTMETAKAILRSTEITTLCLKGKADIVLFPELSTCVQWPWNPINSR